MAYGRTCEETNSLSWLMEEKVDKLIEWVWRKGVDQYNEVNNGRGSGYINRRSWRMVEEVAKLMELVD